ncbi:MAG TPA: LCP family protein, partial [Acidimicrobiia bacterium]|nr:LCP family protein [Acidimicrobiia bacterium]
MGIQIAYAITTNFPGFVAMVDEVGGVDVNVPRALDDYYSGAVFLPGPQHLTGDQALRLSRDRHDYSNGDISRTGNQALVIISALGTLRAQNPGAVGTAHLVSLLVRHVRMLNVDLTELFRLGRLALSIDPANVRNVTIPVGSGSGTNLLVSPEAQSLFADFRDDAVLQTH